MSSVNVSSAKAQARFNKLQANGFATKMLLILITGGLVMLAAGGGVMYFYVQHQKASVLGSSDKDKESNALIAEVGKLIELPKGEQPTIATVSDINKLKGQAFFAQAKNGDKVLIYTKAQKAILYDPIDKKIVEVGPINLNQTTPPPTASASAKPTGKVTPTPTGKVTPTPSTKPLSVALYNGTTIAGYAGTMGTQLQTSMPNVTVTAKQNASKATYTKTTVVDLTGKQKTAAAQVAKALGGSVGTLPAGETKPTGVDLLVVLGK